MATHMICSAVWKTLPQLNIGEVPSHLNLTLPTVTFIVIIICFNIVFFELALVYFLLSDQCFSAGIFRSIKICVMNVLCKFASGKQALHAHPTCIRFELIICQWCTPLSIRRDRVKVCLTVNCVITHNPSVVFYRLFPPIHGDFSRIRIFYVSLSVLDSGRFSCSNCYEP